MELKNSETLKILTRLFAGECQDGAKYQYMADTATTEKLSYVSTILKQLATNEMAHAKVFYDYINEKCPGGVEMVEIKASYPMQMGSLEELLKIEGENEKRQGEFVYPEFARKMEKEGFDDIANKVKQIGKIEECHASVLNQLYKKISENKLYNFDKERKVKCFNCGHEEKLKKVWKKCPICNKNQGFVKINLEENSENV